MSRLVMRRGPDPGTSYELTAEIVRVGRGAKNEIVIQDNDVDREHCRLVRFLGEYELEDLGSRSGTFLNGQRVIGKRMLQADAVIELGEQITFLYEHDPNSSSVLKVRREELAAFPKNNVNPYLVLILPAPAENQVFTLTSDLVTVGRDLTSTVVIQEPEVSRNHLRMSRQGSNYSIEDLGSTNGTFVDGEALQPGNPVTLKGGEVLEIGMMVQLVYTWEPNQLPTNIEKPGALPSVELPKTRMLSATDDFKVVAALKKSEEHPAIRTSLKPGDLKDHVIIAYARQHWEAVAAPLFMALTKAGLKAWADQYLERGSDQWIIDAEQAQAEGLLLIVIVTPEALESRYVKSYYRYFFNRDKPIINLIYEPLATLPPEMATARTVTYNAEDPQRSFQRVIFEIINSKP